MTSEIGTLISTIATAIASMASVVAVFVAFKAAKYASHQANLLRDQVIAGQFSLELEVHSRFQGEMRAIQRMFSSEVNKLDWIPSDSERRGISLYWYLVFDEWLTCKKMHIALAPLWDQKYSEGVQSALRKPAFFEVAREMFQGDSTFFGYGKEYASEIDRLCRVGTGKPLL